MREMILSLNNLGVRILLMMSLCAFHQVYVRAMIEYWPQEDPTIPCMDAGLPFQKGDILQIVDQNDALWWQARKISDLDTCAGLIPSNQLLKR